MSNTKSRKVAVLCINSQGEAEFHTCEVEVTAAEASEGRHYELARQSAAERGYEHPMIAFDESDAAARQLKAVGFWVN